MFLKTMGVLSTIQLRVWGFCPRVFCPWDFCPRGVLSVLCYSVAKMLTKTKFNDTYQKLHPFFICVSLSQTKTYVFIFILTVFQSSNRLPQNPDFK